MRRFFITLLMLCLALPAALHAAPLAVRLRAGVHEDFQRIVFDWPAHISYTLRQDGSTITLSFLGEATIDVAAITRRRLTVIHDVAQESADGATIIRMNLADAIVASSYQDEGRVVVDFRKGAVIPRATEVAYEKQVFENQLGTTPADEKKPGDKQAGEKQADQQPINEKKPDGRAPIPEALPLSAPPPAKDEVRKNETPHIEPPAFDRPHDNEDVGALTVRMENLQPRTRKEYTAPDLGTLGPQPVGLVALDPGLVMGAAIYKRAGFVYIALERKITLPLEKLAKQLSTITLESVDSLSGSVFRFYLPQDLSLRIVRDDSAWSIYASQAAPAAPISLPIQAQPSYALGGRLILPLSKAGDPVRFYDPEVGDLILIVPLVEAGQAIRQRARYADLDFLPAEQGIVVNPHIDGIAIRRVTQGIEITVPGGLRLSSSRDTGLDDADASTNSGTTTRLFDFRAWYGPRSRSYTVMRQRWERTLAEVPPQDRDRIRLEMARFNFARNHPQEALGILNLLKATLPDIETRTEYLTLRGAVRVLTRDAEGALKDLQAAGLDEDPEIKLWQGAAYARLLNWKESSESFKAGDAALDNYPEPLFTQFSLLAVEAGLAAGDKVMAGRSFDRLIQRRPELEARSAAVNFLRGVFMADAGHLDRAELFWKRAAGSQDQLYRVRASLALTDLAVVRGKITPGEAAERLERLRYAWRGDDLELDILRRLGKFYIESGKFEEGLMTLKQVIAFLPNNDAAKELRQEMALTFRDVFLGERSNKISPLDALSLYERFYELAPEGDEGDSIIRTLADRMVAVDLLDRAAEVLADQAKRRLSGTIKSRVGAQAAGIYLLDHKPDPALTVLSETEVESAPEELKSERNLIKAKALSGLNRNEEALALIAHDESEYAQRLKADIAWRSRAWVDAAKQLGVLIGPAPAPDAKLSAQAAQLVINRGIALAMANDGAGLEDLKKNFYAAMKTTPQADLFRVLTEPETGLPRDENAMKSFMADVDLFQDFLENYRKMK